ncbi:hypothetical protein [Pedobacter deserti]|uniref:hypothetical protein n=1 Tax=Pedobacter deserti TaxID=2817382 RepID=UPI00210A8095|nr:hypothetical protein [Pedobacter sp. SYSU D00382]
MLLGRSEGYVGMVESLTSQTQYPPNEWPKLAKALNCTVHDLLPSSQSANAGELVDKVVLSLSDAEDILLVIDGLIGIGYFAQPRSISEVSRYLFIEKADQVEVLANALKLATSDSELAEQDGKFVAIKSV